jgi:peptidylprolyl isomerase
MAALLAGALTLAFAASAQQAPAPAPAQPSVTAAAAAADTANWRKVDPQNLLLLTIANSQIVLVELRPDFAPRHIEQIRKIARAGHYDGLPFHRVIDNFMAQGGEVYAKYMLYPRPYGELQAEFTFQRKPGDHPVQWLSNIDAATSDWQRIGYFEGFIVAGKHDNQADFSNTGTVPTFALHCAGIASMARATDPNSADTQFFLMRRSRVGPDKLDADYTIWGRALTGLDVIRSITAGPQESDGRLSVAAATKLTRARIVADLPAAQQPAVYVQRTDGPAFATQLAAARRTITDATSACELPPVPVIVETPQ